MNSTSIYQDLFDHNDWANQKLFRLCMKLEADQLDQSRKMGFGTLRNTCFHFLEGESIWLERWNGKPWRPFQREANGMKVQEILEQLKAVAIERNQLIATEQNSDFKRIVEFRDSANSPYAFSIADLLNHVSNHGIHHRAQVLSFLRSFGVTIPAGVDYIFWKLAYPSCEQPAESIGPIREYGLEMANGEGLAPVFERERIQRYFSYHRWATNRVMDAADHLSDDQLDREFEMGWGTIRKNLQHLINADQWWIWNWSGDSQAFPSDETSRSLSEMRAQFDFIHEERSEFIDSLDVDLACKVLTVFAGGPPSCFRITESLLQLCGHGTHHRAQCLNMLRQLGTKPPAIDLIVMMREEADNKMAE